MKSSFDEWHDTGYHDQRWDDSSSDHYRSRPGDIDELSSRGDDTYESDLNVLDILNTLRVVGGSAEPVASAPWPRHDAESFSIISSAQQQPLQPGVPQSLARRQQSPLVKALRPAGSSNHDGGRHARQLAAARLNAHAQGHAIDHQHTPKAHLSSGGTAPPHARPSQLPGAVGTPMRRSHAADPCGTPMRRFLVKHQALLKVGESQWDTLPCMHACLRMAPLAATPNIFGNGMVPLPWLLPH